LTVPDLEKAFILHSRTYRETSRLVDFLSFSQGRLRAVARGVRGKNARYSYLQPFVKLQIEYRGKGDLKTLTHCEPEGCAVQLSGERLYSAMYINELLYRLLPEFDPHPQLFNNYVDLLSCLERQEELEPLLRQFELGLLDELGYGLMLDSDAVSGDRVEEEGVYQIIPDQGPVRYQGDSSVEQTAIFSGADLLNISAGNYDSVQVRRAAKRLLRRVLGFHLGGRTLRSRELFRVLDNEING